MICGRFLRRCSATSTSRSSWTRRPKPPLTRCGDCGGGLDVRRRRAEGGRHDPEWTCCDPPRADDPGRSDRADGRDREGHAHRLNTRRFAGLGAEAEKVGKESSIKARGTERGRGISTLARRAIATPILAASLDEPNACLGRGAECCGEACSASSAGPTSRKACASSRWIRPSCICSTMPPRCRIDPSRS